MLAMPSTSADAEQITREWLEQVVIGLGLCPFAAQPTLEKRVRIEVSDCSSELDLLETLHDELTLLGNQSAAILETTLLVVPNMLLDFAEYNQFLDRVDGLLAQFGWEETYQIASFHPQYCFADIEPTSAENLTNRAPFPTFHIIRENSLSKALVNFPQPEEIPVQNIRRMNALSTEEKLKLFPWLFKTSHPLRSPSK